MPVMECVPDLAFLQMAAASNSDMFNKMLWHPSGGGAGGIAAQGQGTGSGGTMKQRKTNFTSREVESLLKAVADRKDTVLFGVAGGIGWARAWHEVAQRVSAVEGIHRSESDVRKKWTYLKWEAKNTSKPGRDPTSRAVLDILTSRDRGDQPNSLLEQLLVPQGASGSPGAAQNASTPVPIAPKKVSQGNNVPGTGTQQPSQVQPQPPPPPPEVCLKWNSYHTNMRATFPSLLNNEQFVDVTLACEGRSIKCHKVMLSACSSYFEELLSQNPCQHPIVFMRDLKFWEIQALVEFMYCGEVNVTQDRLPSLLAAADALQIKGLAGPSSGTTYDEDVTETDDSVGSVQKFTQQQKRIRKRKSSNPTAYPVRTQCVSQPAKKQQLYQQATKSPQAKNKPQLQQTPNVAQTSTPGRVKKEPDEETSEPLSLVKEEPLNLGSTEMKQRNEQNTMYSQEQNHSTGQMIKPLNGLSDTDETDDDSGDGSGRDQTEDEEIENTQKDISHGNGYESRGDLSRGSSVDTS